VGGNAADRAGLIFAPLNKGSAYIIAIALAAFAGVGLFIGGSYYAF
jgi:hypothetical protein